MKNFDLPKTNRLNFIYNFLKQNYNDYCLINVTASPLKGYNYFKIQDGLYYRLIEEFTPKVLSKESFLNGYKLDNIASQGLTLEAYIEANQMFELNKIYVFAHKQFKIQNFDLSYAECIIEICPDGLNEILIH